MDTRERLLKAARAEFAEKGLAGARIEGIAKRAGVNVERLYYYFSQENRKVKDVVFDLVMEEVMDEIRAQPWDAERLWDYVAEMVAFHLPDPERVRLMIAEGWTMRPLAARRKRVRHYSGRVKDIQETQSTGALYDDYDPRSIALMVLYMVSGPEVFPQLTELIFGLNKPALTATEFREDLRKFFDRGLRKEDGEHRHEAPGA